jgi:hypothetical protein
VPDACPGGGGPPRGPRAADAARRRGDACAPHTDAKAGPRSAACGVSSTRTRRWSPRHWRTGCATPGPRSSVPPPRRMARRRRSGGRRATPGGAPPSWADVDLRAASVSPVADGLAVLGAPFAFATGCGERCSRGVHEAAPVPAKPFDPAALVAVVAGPVAAGVGRRAARPQRRSGNGATTAGPAPGTGRRASRAAARRATARGAERSGRGRGSLPPAASKSGPGTMAISDLVSAVVSKPVAVAARLARRALERIAPEAEGKAERAPRKSKGWRKHVRRMKARQRSAQG